MKNIFILLALASTLSSSCTHAQTRDPRPPREQNPPAENRKIQVALLLDTSNSMDGLIEQAKSRLWNIVNTMTTLKYEGKAPDIEIALYEYGNDGLGKESDYIRQVTPLTRDLDLISEKLFSLRTNGGLEYCGTVIEKALNQLEWSAHDADMKLIYIAGNEPFNQGAVPYKEVIPHALKQQVFVNTIYCGTYDQGVREWWKDAAERGEGKYFNIDANKRIRYIETPYDAEINIINIRLNDTYIGYGPTGAAKKSNQVMQDKNAEELSGANMAERAMTKSSSAYKNADWDLVDAANEGEIDMEQIQEEDLPVELQGKTIEERKTYIDQKASERAALQKQLNELGKKRQAYLEKEMANAGDSDDLGAAIATSIRALAQKKGYK